MRLILKIIISLGVLGICVFAIWLSRPEFLNEFNSVMWERLSSLSELVNPKEEDTDCSLQSDPWLACTKAGNLAKNEQRWEDSETHYRSALLWLGRNEKDSGKTVRAAGTYNHLGLLFDAQGKYLKAEPYYRVAVGIVKTDFENEHELLAGLNFNLGGILANLGKKDTAEPYLQEALRLAENVHGSRTPEILPFLKALSQLYWDKEEYQKSQPLSERLVAIQEGTLDPQHLDLAHTLHNLAMIYQKTSQHTKAVPLFERAASIKENVLGPTDPSLAFTLYNFAESYIELGLYPEAIELDKRALTIREESLGIDHPDTLASLQALADSYSDLGEWKEAFPIREKILKLKKARLEPTDSELRLAMTSLAEVYLHLGKHEKALSLRLENFEIVQEMFDSEAIETAISLDNLAKVYVGMGKPEKALPLGTRALAIWEKARGPEDSDTATCLVVLSTIHARMENYQEALSTGQRALQIRQKVFGLEHLETSQALGNVAEFYRRMGKYEKAFMPAYQAYEIRKKILGSESPRTRQIHHRLQLIMMNLPPDFFIPGYKEFLKQNPELSSIQSRDHVSMHSTMEDTSFSEVVVDESSAHFYPSSSNGRIKTLRLQSLAQMQEAVLDKGTVELFPLYGTGNKLGYPWHPSPLEVVGHISIPKSWTLAKKLVFLSEQLSDHEFQGLIVHFKAIMNDAQGQKIAHFDLIDADTRTWRYAYFTEPTGTVPQARKPAEEVMFLTFLQPYYSGDWIDGVTFSIQGQPMGEAYRPYHLTEPRFRKDFVRSPNEAASQAEKSVNLPTSAYQLRGHGNFDVRIDSASLKEIRVNVGTMKFVVFKLDYFSEDSNQLLRSRFSVGPNFTAWSESFYGFQGDYPLQTPDGKEDNYYSPPVKIHLQVIETDLSPKYLDDGFNPLLGNHALLYEHTLLIVEE